jgi:topoisomerase-4 subunit A
MENMRIEKKVDGIAEVRDESGRAGLRIVIELKKDADAQGVLNYFLKKSDLQVTYNFNMVAIVSKAPRQLGVIEILKAYIEHQKEVVTHRTQYDLEKAEDRAHVLEGLAKALSILDEVITTIKASSNRQQAQANLVEKFSFSERQADAILTLQLYRLTNLEITSIEKELTDISKKIAYLRGILASPKKLINVIKDELSEIRSTYGQDRRSAIEAEVEEIKVNLEVMVPAEDVRVTISNDGYIKRISQSTYARSGAELATVGLKEGDQLRFIHDVNTIDSLLLFTQTGQYFLLPVHQVPEFKWKENGTAIVNIIPLQKDDRIVAVIPIKSFETPDSFLFVTKRGQVKRTDIKEYFTTRSTSIAAIKVADGDEVIEVLVSNSSQQLFLVTKQGMAIRFQEAEVNGMGRVAAGVRGMNLKADDELVAAMLVDNDEGEVGVMTELGYGKRSLLDDYPLQARGGKGVPTFEFKEGKRVKSNGEQLIGAFYVKESYDLSTLTTNGLLFSLNTEAFKIDDRKSIGKLLVPIEKDQSVLKLFSWSVGK